jgi:hypothetical protein
VIKIDKKVKSNNGIEMGIKAGLRMKKKAGGKCTVFLVQNF